MPLVSNRVRVLYAIWWRKGVAANFATLRDTLGWDDERQLRDLVPALIHDGDLEIKEKKGQDYWRVTNPGLRKIRFLTLPWIAYALLVAIGSVLISGGLIFARTTESAQAAGQIGIGIAVVCFGTFLLLNHRNLIKELMTEEG
jgi:hypothetical protein